MIIIFINFSNFQNFLIKPGNFHLFLAILENFNLICLKDFQFIHFMNRIIAGKFSVFLGFFELHFRNFEAKFLGFRQLFLKFLRNFEGFHGYFKVIKFFLSFILNLNFFSRCYFLALLVLIFILVVEILEGFAFRRENLAGFRRVLFSFLEIRFLGRNISGFFIGFLWFFLCFRCFCRIFLLLLGLVLLIFLVGSHIFPFNLWVFGGINPFIVVLGFWFLDHFLGLNFFLIFDGHFFLGCLTVFRDFWFKFGDFLGILSNFRFQITNLWKFFRIFHNFIQIPKFFFPVFLFFFVFRTFSQIIIFLIAKTKV